MHNLVTKIENCLTKNKNLLPENIENAKNRLSEIHQDIGSDNLKYIKIYYQGKLSSINYIPNSLTVLALVIAVASIILNLLDPSNVVNTKDDLSWIYPSLLVSVPFLGVIFVLSILLKLIRKDSKKTVTYTILINLIDDIIDDK
ncbi:hypothetical protein ACFSTH_09280 [Paenibacillus yanchengensis]|uniref:Uncharacterized protein n=1 Tax=Paenibacillus yanchengensis TaxID=2035833 RepID=A0ABW4YL49_9BACL